MSEVSVSIKRTSKDARTQSPLPVLLMPAGKCVPPIVIRRASGVSRSACKLDRTYGCYDGELRMWASTPCRGHFRCARTVVLCGNTRNGGQNCTCDQSAMGWPGEEHATKALQELKRPQTPPVTNLWLAAIISTNARGERFAIVTKEVSQCGFVPMHVPAVMPNHFTSAAAMVEELFGNSKHLPRVMSAYEIGLLISHKRALAAIAQSTYEWGGIFEDDAYLSELVAPWQARSLIQSIFSLSGDRALVYLGACDPHCEPSDQTRFAGLPPALLRGPRCKGLCTHAYALSRHLAGTFFADVFNCHNGSKRCGAECTGSPCYADWAFKRHLARGHDAWVVGGGLHSRFKSDHRGIFVQNRSSFRNNQSGTALKRHFSWSGIRQTPKTARICRYDDTLVTRLPLRQVVVTVRWTGRVGNLLFELAALLGVIHRLRAVVPARAIVLELPSTEQVPAAELFKQFPLLMNALDVQDAARIDGGNVRQASNAGVFANAYEGMLRNCSACTRVVQEKRANAHDEDVLRQLEGWVASPPPYCSVGLIELVGYWQSFKYFDGAAEASLRTLLAAPSATTVAAAEPVLARARRSSTTQLIGVQIRLGDKIKGHFKELYAQVDWTYYRAGMQHLASTLRGTDGNDVAFIITAGGSMGSNQDDMAEAQTHLSSAADHVTFSDSPDPYVDLAILRACDGLVVGASSLGWWAAYLSRLPAARLVAPNMIFNEKLPASHPLMKGFRREDYYPPGWLLLPNNGQGPIDQRPPPPPTPLHPPKLSLRRHIGRPPPHSVPSVLPALFPRGARSTSNSSDSHQLVHPQKPKHKHPVMAYGMGFQQKLKHQVDTSATSSTRSGMATGTIHR